MKNQTPVVVDLLSITGFRLANRDVMQLNILIHCVSKKVPTFKLRIL